MLANKTEIQFHLIRFNSKIHIRTSNLFDLLGSELFFLTKLLDQKVEINDPTCLAGRV